MVALRRLLMSDPVFLKSQGVEFVLQMVPPSLSKNSYGLLIRIIITKSCERHTARQQDQEPDILAGRPVFLDKLLVLPEPSRATAIASRIRPCRTISCICAPYSTPSKPCEPCEP